MKVYKASQELIDILLRFGFRDETERYYPEHFQRLRDNKYNPLHVKRRFSTGSYKDYVVLDYINIKITDEKDTYVLTEDELKSLIVFHYLSPEDRRKWRESMYGKLEAWKLIADTDKYPAIYPSALFKRIRSKYDSLADFAG